MFGEMAVLSFPFRGRISKHYRPYQQVEHSPCSKVDEMHTPPPFLSRLAIAAGRGGLRGGNSGSQ